MPFELQGDYDIITAAILGNKNIIDNIIKNKINLDELYKYITEQIQNYTKYKLFYLQLLRESKHEIERVINKTKISNNSILIYCVLK